MILVQPNLDQELNRVHAELRTLHQVELGSADPVQLNGRGYTVDDTDWSSRAQPVG